MAFEETLQQRLLPLGVTLSPQQLSMMVQYHTMLMDSNRTLNLTAIDDEEEAVQKHYLDSLSPLPHGLLPQHGSLIDVGSGAGFPGLPLAIARPDLSVLLLDSLQKRIAFLNDVINFLQLNNVTTLHARAEDAARQDSYRDAFDISVSRAVGALPTLCEYCLPFVKPGGKLIAYKGPSAIDEILQARRAIDLLGGGDATVLNANIPQLQHTLVVVEKSKPTPEQYPRRAGTPTKHPL